MTNDRFAREWFEQVWNQQREDAIDRMMAAHAVIHDLAPTGPMKGPADFKPFYRRFLQAFPDMRVDVLRTVSEGDLVAVHCRVSATHTGDALGPAATNRKASISGIAIARVQNDQLVEGWNCFDFLSLYQQLGLVAATV
jgi:steroid delta-isomerase-like uncharacterized protein